VAYPQPKSFRRPCFKLSLWAVVSFATKQSITPLSRAPLATPIARLAGRSLDGSSATPQDTGLTVLRDASLLWWQRGVDDFIWWGVCSPNSNEVPRYERISPSPLSDLHRCRNLLVESVKSVVRCSLSRSKNLKHPLCHWRDFVSWWLPFLVSHQKRAVLCCPQEVEPWWDQPASEAPTRPGFLSNRHGVDDKDQGSRVPAVDPQSPPEQPVF